MKHKLTRAAVVLACLAAAACTSDPAAPPSSSSAPALPSSTAEKAPAVAKPLNASIFFTEPCRTLDAGQRKKFKLDEGLERTPRQCYYLDAGKDRMWLAFSTTEDGGLGTWYARPADKGRKPAEVDGYPALYPTFEEHADGCSIAVGIADTADFSMGFTYGGKPKTPDACGQVQTLAATVLATLRKLPPGSTAPPAPRAPQVTKPLPSDAFVQQPCTSIGDAERAALKKQGIALDAGKNDTTGPSHIACDYGDTKARFFVELSYTNDAQGLSGLYERHHDGDFANKWEPITLTGYPGVVTADSRCSVSVALTDSRYFTVAAYYLDESKPLQPCTQAKQVAQAVITTLTG